MASAIRRGKTQRGSIAVLAKPKAVEELYDLEADPDEVHNLADSPEHRDVLARMREAHAATGSTQIKDVGFLSEWEMHERSKGTTPYEMGHDPKAYDFDAVFAAANKATSRKTEDLSTIARLLSEKDSGVRYWGAIGLLTQGKAGVAAGHEALVGRARG